MRGGDWRVRGVTGPNTRPAVGEGRPRPALAPDPVPAAGRGRARVTLEEPHRRSPAVNARDERIAAATDRVEPASAPHEVKTSPALNDGVALEGRSLDYWLLSRLRSFLGDPPVEFAIANGGRAGPRATAPVARVTFASRATLASIVADPWLRFGDAYSDGLVDVEGDLVGLLETVYRSSGSGGKRGSLLRRAADALRRPHTNTLSGSRDNIHHHYDIGNDFYEMWLGSTMAYTCAYYPTPEASLDEAQVAKMDHVCRKLRLKAGESVVEAGCGW